MKVLVTGADGFVGAHLCQALEARGDAVFAAGGPGGKNGLEITDKVAVSGRIEQFRPEALIHLAAISSVARSHSHPSGTVAVNVLGTMNVLEAVQEHAPKARVLLIGSGEEYGRLTEGVRATESHPLAPVSPYAASKVAVEVLARQALETQGTAVVLVRPFNHLGPGQAAGFVVPSFAQQLVRVARKQVPPVVSVGDLTPVRDFSHVLDVVDAYLLLLDKGEPGDVYNVCSGEGWAIRQILDELQRLAGTRAEVRVDAERVRPTEIPWLVGDPGKVERLGWRRRRSVTQALQEVLEEHRA
jgi:GDP-4-dehydro-6-deoxy-D-mannose reductase